METQEKLLYLRGQIANLVTDFAKEQYKETPFIPGETVIPPSGKL